MDSTFNSDVSYNQTPGNNNMMMTDRTLSSIRDSTPKKRRGPETNSNGSTSRPGSRPGSTSRPGSRSGIRMANPSPLKRSKTPMVHTGKRGNILSRRAEEAVRLKDEQLKLLQNQKLEKNQRKAVLKELVFKLNILMIGAEKRNNMLFYEEISEKKYVYQCLLED